MLNNLKKKLNAALHNGLNITERMQHQYRSSMNIAQTFLHDDFDHNPSGLPQGVNLAVGCELLSKYESEWEYIHRKNVENVQKAESLAKQIANLEEQLIKHQTTVKDMFLCVATLPNIVEQLKACQITLSKVESLCEIVAAQCDKLEDLCDECEFRKFVWQKQMELKKHKQKKIHDLELHRRRICHEYLERTRQHEKKLEQIQKERQTVFENEFRHDLEDYKQKGYLYKKEPKNSVTEISLEEVALDPDFPSLDALEDFLKD